MGGERPLEGFGAEGGSAATTIGTLRGLTNDWRKSDKAGREQDGISPSRSSSCSRFGISSSSLMAYRCFRNVSFPEKCSTVSPETRERIEAGY